MPEVLTSQLSIILAYGIIDIKQIVTQLIERYEEDEHNIEQFIRELMFREFYYVLMTHYPNTVMRHLMKNIVTLNGNIIKRIIKVGVKGVLVFQ